MILAWMPQNSIESERNEDLLSIFVTCRLQRNTGRTTGRRCPKQVYKKVAVNATNPEEDKVAASIIYQSSEPSLPFEHNFIQPPHTRTKPRPAIPHNDNFEVQSRRSLPAGGEEVASAFLYPTDSVCTQIFLMDAGRWGFCRCQYTTRMIVFAIIVSFMTHLVLQSLSRAFCRETFSFQGFPREMIVDVRDNPTI